MLDCAMLDLSPAVDTTFRRRLAVTAGEDGLVIVDPEKQAIGEALREGAAGLGADAALLVMDERAEHGTEPPPPVAAALAACDVFMAVVPASLTGNVLEDEKSLGSVHVAFGASAGIGGTVSVPIHIDAVVADASLTVDGRPVRDAGRYVTEG
jgi:hypothetical protein